MGWPKRSQSKLPNSVEPGLRKAKTYAFSLRSRLIGLVLLVVVLVLALIYTNFEERRHQTTQIQAEALQITRLATANQERLINSQGIILARYPNPETWVAQASPEAPLVKTMLTQKRAGMVEASGVDGVTSLYAIAPLEGTCRDQGDRCNLYVSVGIPKTVAFTAADRQLHRNLAGMGLVAVLAIAATWVGSEVLMLCRVKALLKAMQQLSEGDLSVRSGVTHGFGVRELAGAFDTMAASLERSERDRQSAETVLREREKKYRSLVNSLPQVLFQTDEAGYWTFLNPAWKEITGFALEESIGKNLIDFVHPSDRPQHLEEFRSLIERQQESYRYQARYLSANGDYRWLEGHGKLTLASDGTIIGTSGTLRDITDQKQAQEALLTTNQTLQTLIETSPLAIVTLDVNRNVTLWNPEAERLFDWKSAEVVGYPLPIFPPDQQEAFHALLQADLHGGGDRGSGGREFRSQKKDGTLIDVSLWTALLQDVNGKMSGSIGIFANISESLRHATLRNRALEALRESETRYRLVAKASNDAIWDWDLLTNRVEWNESLQKLFGYAETEVGFDASWWYENIHPEDRERVVSGIHAAIDSGRQIWSDEYRYRRADNSYALASDRGFIVHDDKGNPVRMIGAMIDISESLRHATLRKQAEALIAGQKQVLEMIATGAALGDVLDVLARFIETQSGEGFCSILLVDEKENKLRHGVAPSLPESYTQAIDGIAIGPGFGCCSKAAYFGKPVIVSDIESDRLWADFRDLALSHQLQSCWSTPIFSSNGKVLGVFVMYHPDARRPNRDELYLTEIATQIAGIALERQQAEAALQQSEDQLRLITDALPVLIAYVDLEQCYRFSNQAYQQWFGKSQAEVIGQPIRKILGDSAYQAIQPYVEAALSGQEVTYESPISYEYGGMRWVNATYLPHFGEHGEVKGFIALVSNITERKAAEEALRQSEERYRSLARATSQMVWICNPQGEVVTDQPDWRAYTGQSEAEILSWHWLDAIHPDDRDRIAEQWSNAIQTKSLYDTEFRLRRADGIYRYFNVRGVPVLSKDGDVREWIGTCTDITEKVQAEEAIRQLNAELEQRVIKRTAQLEAANQELEAFCYSISHDLRSPLRAINGFSRILLEEYLEQLDPEAQRYQKLVRDNAQQMGQLIDDLLTFSRLSRQPLRKQAVAIADLVRQVLADLWHEQQNRQFEINIGNLPACEGDPALLKQVVVNLLTNALKFTRGREVAQIEIGYRHQSFTNDPELETNDFSTTVVYFVKDNGAGFDMRYAHKLFGVFQRLHRAEDYEGTGVGLAIVQRIIHRHGGRIWAESGVNQGTTFYFTLAEGNIHE
ncbi:PAS domain S-box protein [Coleofasciculus sp. FACHB-64]|uniref:PAS domain S-box protein n=1 Tax=Cyanophyceae TaxID=3028117 RepID=UPI0016884767|nr:PAS domain S-box protein [Coleofasciculus sp. FACHB-64]MBD2045631.1 PAS domain S-box protein [Coleofasciculus sp. FACHB-64]